jgi:hypothetical protein
MHDPVHLDGRTLVILRQSSRGFLPIASGELSYDGETLLLIVFGRTRAITSDKLAAIKNVTESNKIRECQGFDLFLIEAS